jgi:hypothetical protein
VRKAVQKMTEELKNALADDMDKASSEMEKAIESGDQKMLWTANLHCQQASFRSQKANSDCQLKTSRRVKGMQKAVWLIGVAVVLLALGARDVVLNVIKAFFALGG